MDWKLLRFHLFQALDTLDIKEIYMIERVNNVVTLCIVTEGLEKIRPLVRMNIIDKLIEKNAPDIYASYLFCYEVWLEKEWRRQYVAKVLHRKQYELFKPE